LPEVNLSRKIAVMLLKKSHQIPEPVNIPGTNTVEAK
jgi:hypothetical protein